MVLPYDIIEHIADYADIDTRRALGFKPRKLKREFDIKLKRIVIFEDPHVVLTVCGEGCMTNMKIYKTKVEINKTFLNALDGTKRTTEIFFLG